LPAALLSASLFAACQNTARGVEEDTEQNTAAARQESREAGAEMREDTREAGAAAERAGDRIANESREIGTSAERAGDRVANESREAASSVGATLDAAAQTMQIKTALIDADDLDAGAIDVDTNADNKTVVLRGHVPTAAQKAAAERIAKNKAPEYRIVNNIEVRAR
jgi:predicted small secreted protein